ncbi:MAG: hypothetical protein H6737_31495 [Alphaproteobacteria bacterium]|nr:hypothetical protein [Alphaproteobacteria bacterium]
MATALREGWPHQRALVTAKSKKSPEERAAAVIGAVDPVSVAWTQEVALAYLRGAHLGRKKPTPAELERMKGPEALGADELDAVLDAWGASRPYWFHLEHLVLLAEALVGADATVSAIARWLERRSPRGWGADAIGTTFGNAMTTPASLAFLVGFPLMRATDPAARRDELEAVRAKGPVGSTASLLLGLVLDGAGAARAAGVRHLFGLHFVDDADLIREISSTDRMYSSLSPRFAWLGGPEVLGHLVERARTGLPPWYATRAVDELGVFAAPETVDLLAVLASKSKSKSAALKWFAAHADFADTHRDRWASTPAAAEIAGVLGGAPAPKPAKKLGLTELRARTADLLRATAAAWRAAPDPAARVACLRDATREYADLCALAGLDPDPRAGHVFCVDGAGDAPPVPEILGLDGDATDAFCDAFDEAWSP